MTPHHSNVRDVVFDLLEPLDRRSAHGQGAFAEMDADGAVAVLAEADRYAWEKLAGTFGNVVNVVPQVAGLPEGAGTLAQQRLAELMCTNRWVTMVLTGPDAGSDVGSARIRAVPQPEDPEVQARPGAEGVTL